LQPPMASATTRTVAWKSLTVRTRACKTGFRSRQGLEEKEGRYRKVPPFLYGYFRDEHCPAAISYFSCLLKIMIYHNVEGARLSWPLMRGRAPVSRGVHPERERDDAQTS
jgi:hypothetical protein